MSETVMVALITFSAGVVGACIGAVTTYQVTKFSIVNERVKMRREEKKLGYSVFLKEYISFTSKFISSGLGIVQMPIEEEQLAAIKLQSTYNQTILISSDEVMATLSNLIDLVLKNAEKGALSGTDLHAAYISTVNAMRRDLSHSMEKRRRYFR